MKINVPLLLSIAAFFVAIALSVSPLWAKTVCWFIAAAIVVVVLLYWWVSSTWGS